MGQFLYFVDQPRAEPIPDSAWIASRGLAYAFPAVPRSTFVASSAASPSGQPGYLLTGDFFGQNEDFPPEYQPQSQEWFDSPGLAYRLGFYRNAKPTPGELAKDVELPCMEYPLADGNHWRIPIVKVSDEGELRIALQRKMMIGKTGDWEPGDVVDEWKYLLEIVDPFIDEWCKLYDLYRATGVEMPFRHSPFDDAAKLLGVTYRVTRYELASLGVFHNGANCNATQVLMVACDVHSLAAWIKKKESAIRLAESSESDSMPGVAVGAPPMSLRSAS